MFTWTASNWIKSFHVNGAIVPKDAVMTWELGSDFFNVAIVYYCLFIN